jgi:hypothetical protein
MVGMLLRFKLSPAVRMLLIAAALGLCLTPVHSQNTTATVMSQVGQVSVISDSRDMQALYVGGAVRPQQIIVTGPDGYATFQVSDGSTFEVFQNARVVFRPTMGKWTDLLNVVIGRVKVFITHPNGKLNPNEVSSPTAVISVRGTVFDVIVEDVDGTTLVTLDEGVVTVRNLTAAGNSVQLNPGDFVRVFRNQQLGAVKPDKSNAVQMALRALRDAALQGLRGPGQRAGVGLPGGSVPGAQGDKGKTGTSAPGAPPAAPGGPPPPPGGH